MTDVKICGIQTPETLDVCVANGARFIGFVFHEPSPRHISFDVAWNLARMVPTGVRSVGLFVNSDNAYIDAITSGIQLDMIQLHGDETPARVQEIKSRTNMPVIKAIRIGDKSDLKDVSGHEAVANWLLFDKKSNQAHGGTGEAFDWDVLKGRKFKKPWMVSGGLTAKNVGEAIAALAPNGVDVSSGVESVRGMKDIEKIKKFLQAVKK